MRADFSPNQKNIWVRFPYDHHLVRKAKRVPGARFVPEEKGGPAWSYPLELKTARILREELGYSLSFSQPLIDWGKAERAHLKQQREMSLQEDATPKRLPPALASYLRPYQRADVVAMADHSMINANEPGLGKTVEVIAAVHEMFTPGCNLVIAPMISHELVWEREIMAHHPTSIIFTGSTPAQRRQAASDLFNLHDQFYTEDMWLLINPATVKMPEVAPLLQSMKWKSVTIDEFHTMGLSNPNTDFFKTLRRIPFERMWALSGTPFGGRAISMWAVLNMMYPKQYGSRWRWARQWLKVTSNGFGLNIGDLIDMREPEFWRAHAGHVLRRTKKEHLPDLPPKTIHHMTVKMTPKQAKQYAKFEADAEIKIDGRRITGLGALAEFALLKFFAFSACDIKGKKQQLHPTEDSGKLEGLMGMLAHQGVDTGGAPTVITTQSSRIAVLTHRYLSRKLKGKVLLITGATKPADRKAAVNDFQAGKAVVLIMTTQMGGVSITLDKAESIHILDETWNPADQQQAEDRVHRGNTDHPVDVYYWRTEGTVEQYIFEVNGQKRITDDNILDIHRKAALASGRA